MSAPRPPACEVCGTHRTVTRVRYSSGGRDLERWLCAEDKDRLLERRRVRVRRRTTTALTRVGVVLAALGALALVFLLGLAAFRALTDDGGRADCNNPDPVTGLCR